MLVEDVYTDKTTDRMLTFCFNTFNVSSSIVSNDYLWFVPLTFDLNERCPQTGKG